MDAAQIRAAQKLTTALTAHLNANAMPPKSAYLKNLSREAAGIKLTALSFTGTRAGFGQISGKRQRKVSGLK
jgi:NifU-like protein involved in Fe-S cluster formation